MNKVVLGLPHDATVSTSDSRSEDAPADHNDLDHLIGQWTVSEAGAFDRWLSTTRKIEDELWA
ncbi:MAG: hypothetical protein EPO26_12545 [Chloroflexota bacterium]|nr:MAG: hypothetical protein EPO26_12545 [Chloroflexota bacterium]